MMTLLTPLFSKRAAFLGDSDFPNSILPKYYKAGRIGLFQNLFRIYSGLNFTRLSDRSRAIAGLERRLRLTFKTDGDYGIFECYLERSLLWKRKLDDSFTLIHYSPGKGVPSWSWMSYDGQINYLEIPFGTVDWSKDYELRLRDEERTIGNKEAFLETENVGFAPSLKTHQARRLLQTGEGLEGKPFIVYDLDPPPTERIHLRCIVFGKSKTPDLPALKEGRWNYVLIIEPVVNTVKDLDSKKRGSSYRRVGVGSLPDNWIDWTTTETVEVY